MKKQINPNIKAYLVRSSFYVLLLLAVCVIPFALAQRNTSRSRVASKARHATTAATSKSRNDIASATKPNVAGAKKKIQATSTRFTNAFGRAPRSASLRKLAAPSGICSYEFVTGADAIVPGTTDIGNHTDDGDTFVSLPFSFSLYDQTFTGVNLSSNGRVDLVTINEPGGFASACLPAPPNIGPFDYTIFPLWTDYRTDVVGEGCSSFATGCGIFTSVSGSAPNRIFNIEWRAVYFADHNATANFEVRLYENDPNLRYDVIFGTVNPGSDQLYVSGVQGPPGIFTQDFCDANPPAAGSRTYTCTGTGPTPTPTPACTPAVFQGSIDASDPTQTDRLFRDGIPSTCDAPKACPGPFGDGLQHHYDQYTLTNTTGSTQCVSVDASTNCVGTNYIFLAAYLGSFNPADLCANYLADQGSSPDPSAPPGPFSFNLDDGQTVVIVVSEVTADAGCPDYTITVSNLCGAGGGPCALQPWQIVANYPETLESAAICTDGTNAYGAGGNAAGFPTSGFYKYDGASWSALAPLPAQLYDGRSVYAANVNKIYFFGGIDVNFAVVNTTYAYDLATNTWAPAANMPDFRFFPAAVYYDPTGLIYVAGGIDANFAETSTTWIYDPVADSWADAGTTIPVPMGGSAVSLVGQNMYLQGSFGSGATTFNYAYDIVANTWTQKADLPAPRYEAAGGSIGTNTYVTGGGDPFVAPGSIKTSPKGSKGPHGSMTRPDTTFSTTFVYDTVNDSWSNGPNTNVGHSFTGGTAVGNDLLVVCGFDGVTGDTNIVEKAHCGPGGGTPTPTPTATPTPGGTCPPVITQSTSQEIVSGNSVACNNGFGTTENHYWRAFNMADFTGGQDYIITSVSFGVELAQSGTGTGQPLTVNLYANHGSPFPGGDWQSNLIATSGEINIPDQSLTIFNVPLSATAPGSALELVMEVTTPDGTVVGNLFFIGSNPDPETGTSYLSAADCGITDPTPVGDIGFPTMHIVFDVNGSCGGTPTPSPTPTPTPGTPTPTPTPATPTPTPGTPTPTPGTPTPTPTASPIRPTPTPRPQPTPYPRPTPV
jgi:N-acetylneuraminic acid mutarotase